MKPQSSRNEHGKGKKTLTNASSMRRKSIKKARKMTGSKTPGGKTPGSKMTGSKKSASKTAKFKQQRKHQPNLHRGADEIISVGWINNPLNLGLLINRRNESKRVVFEFILNGKKIDAWSALSAGWGEKNEQLLKTGFQYVVSGQICAQLLSRKKYDRASNSTFKFKLHLMKISIIMKEKNADNTNAVAAHANTLDTFEQLNQLISSGQSFTRNVSNVIILSGDVRRYMGCSTCFSGISKPTKGKEFYCKRCKLEPTRRVCLIIRNLKFEDSCKNVLENALCFHEQCKQLFGIAVVEDLCSPSSSDLLARNEFEFLKGSTITTITIKHQMPTGSQQTSFNFSKVIVTNLLDIKYNNPSRIQKEVTGRIRLAGTSCDLNNAQCLCAHDENDDSDDDDDEDCSHDQKFTLPSIIRNQGKVDSNLYYPLVPDKEGWTGMCIIINMKKGRKGSKHDVKRLKNLFPQLGVEIFHKRGLNLNDLNKEQFIAAVEAFKRQLINGNYSSLFFVFMSHGSLYSVRLDDNTVLGVYKDILPLFGEKQFPEFSGKPKIFVFQACQNIRPFKDMESAFDFTARLAVDDTDFICDTLECYPCLPGAKAKRCPEKGSYFIQTLVNVFENNWMTMDIEQMLKKVQNEMKNMRLGDDKESVNIPVYKPIIFSRDFYFYGRTQKNIMTDEMNNMEITDE